MNAPRNDAPAVLELRGIRKTYGRHIAVEGVDLTLRGEEFLTFLGPSGSGKTTTLMMVAGLQQPDSGEIVLAGRSVERVPAYRRDIGMVFQHYALFPHMSVRRNVAFPLEMRRTAQAEIDARVADVLGLVGLGEFGDRLPRQLSGGQQQRVALARALVYGPPLLLMDEPLGALDKKLREQLQREIKRVHRERRTSVLYVTHDQEEALTMSDRVAVFNRGRIEQVGTPAELYERPRTRFVAGFVGEMNFLRGTVVERQGETARVDLSGTSVLGRAAEPGIEQGAQVVAAVRPERTMARALGAGGGGVRGRVVEEIYLGNARRLVVRLPDASDCLVLQGVDSAGPIGLAPGNEVSLGFEPEHTTIFVRSPDT